MGLGLEILEILAPIMESIAPHMPGETFPEFFTLEMFQRSMLAALMVAIVGGFLGSFLLVRNLALIGDGLAHVSFGGVAIGIVLGATSPLWYALMFSLIASILIYEMQAREILTGDASIAIFLTGMLALGLVVLRYYGVGITVEVESYLWGSLLLTSSEDLDLIAGISLLSFLLLYMIKDPLLATTVDPLAASVQGIPVRVIGLVFSAVTAAVVVSMVQVVGTLLVTALLVTPAATAQQVGRSTGLWHKLRCVGPLFLCRVGYGKRLDDRTSFRRYFHCSRNSSKCQLDCSLLCRLPTTDHRYHS